MARVADTTALTYNTTHHMFVLDPEYLKDTWDIDVIKRYGSKTKAINGLLKISIRIYNYIYNHKQRNKEYWQYYLAFSTEVTDTLRQTLEQQALFDSESNAMSLQNVLGVNLLNGKVVALEHLRGDRGIAIEALNALRNYKDGLLIYIGKEMYLPQTSEFDYDEMGY
jgi:hypothetical protein